MDFPPPSLLWKKPPVADSRGRRTRRQTLGILVNSEGETASPRQKLAFASGSAIAVMAKGGDRSRGRAVAPAFRPSLPGHRLEGPSPCPVGETRAVSQGERLSGSVAPPVSRVGVVMNEPGANFIRVLRARKEIRQHPSRGSTGVRTLIGSASLSPGETPTRVNILELKPRYEISSKLWCVWLCFKSKQILNMLTIMTIKYDLFELPYSFLRNSINRVTSG